MEPTNAEPLSHNPVQETVRLAQNDNVGRDPTENGYCDSLISDCPPPAASNGPPSVQHTNGGDSFQSTIANQLKSSMGENGRRNEGEIEQPMDASQATADDFLAVQTPSISEYVDAFVREAIKLSDLILMLAITSFTLLVFSLGHYLINKNRREKPLIYKLNMVERDLMTSYKESALLKNELQDTKHKLTSIENNSFGSNDMVIALKAELEAAEEVKLELQDQIAGLEKELENAAEAGLELNKMVAELLNQNGSDSIALSVEELQRQLNEQQQTILSMNASLAEKSRENSDLQITIASQTSKFNERLHDLERTQTELTECRAALEKEVARLQSEQDTKLESLRKESTFEVDRLTKELKVAHAKTEEGRRALAAAEAKCEALDECLKEIKLEGSGGTSKSLIDTVELKAQIALLAKEKASMQDKLQGEITVDMTTQLCQRTKPKTILVHHLLLTIIHGIRTTIENVSGIVIVIENEIVSVIVIVIVIVIENEIVIVIATVNEIIGMDGPVEMEDTREDSRQLECALRHRYRIRGTKNSQVLIVTATRMTN
uniref:Uncharacterized protein n=1 Tax=Anopheles atroparvus TaxID=41427 RepID=A0A182JHF7_ANOAO